MMTLSPTSQSLTIKLSIMLVLILVDLVINSFIESSFTLSFQSYYNVNYYFLVNHPPQSPFR
jgi:lipoprotein signal peptidase